MNSTNKKSFILYTDILDAVTRLPSEVAGDLFKIILRYVTDSANLYDNDEYCHEAWIAFNFIKPGLDLNLEKYEEKCRQNQINGKLGGRPNKPKKTERLFKKPNAYFGNPKNLDNDNDIDNIYTSFKEKVNNGSKLTPNAVNKIKQRLKSYTLEEILKAIESFSNDSWWMEHNSNRGIAWFFNTDDRLDQFINLKARAKPGDDCVPVEEVL